MKAKIFCLFFLIVLEFIVCPQNGWTQDNTIPMIGAYYFDGWSGKNNSQELWAQEAPTHLTEKHPSCRRESCGQKYQRSVYFCTNQCDGYIGFASGSQVVLGIPAGKV